MAQFPIQSTTLKLLEEALSILDSNEQPGLLTDNSNIDAAFSKVCDELSLTSKEVIKIKTAFVSFAAIAEIDNYALEKEGENLSSLVMKMYSQKTENIQMKRAKSFLKQAAIQIGADKQERALELLVEVNRKGTEAIHGEHKRSTSETVDDLVNCTKLLILTNYLMEILHDTGRLVPFKKISSVLKRNIVVNAISHVEEMLFILEENNINLGGLISTMTNSWDKNNVLADLYSECNQWVALDVIDLEDGQVQVTLPSLNTIPHNNQPGVANLKIKRPSETTLSLWIEPNEPNEPWLGWGNTFIVLHIYMRGIVYMTGLNDSHVTEKTKVLLTIEENKVVAVSADTTGYIRWNLANPLELRHHYYVWTSGFIHALAKAVSNGDMKSVEYLKLKLRDFDDKYGLDDIRKATQAIHATKGLFIRWSNLPSTMGVQHWKTAADVAANMDKLYLENINGENGPTECTGFEFELGRLVTKAKEVFCEENQYRNFDLFAKGVLQGMGEEGACCERIEWKRSILHGDDFKVFVEQLGWKIDSDYYAPNGPERVMDMVIFDDTKRKF